MSRSHKHAFYERKNRMKNTFIKILCLSLALMMLLMSSCAPDLEEQDESSADSTTAATEEDTPQVTEDPTETSTESGGDDVTTEPDSETTESEDTSTEETTTEFVEELIAPESPKQTVFCSGMDLTKYFSGLGKGYEISLAEVNCKTVVKVVCVKQSSAKITFDYDQFMTNCGVTPVNGEDVQNVVFMVCKDETGEFTKTVVSASELLTLNEDGTVDTVSLSVFDRMRKNEVWYISSFALASDTNDIILYSDLSKYALGYSTDIEILPNEPVEHNPVTAPAEDSSLLLWFDHATERVMKYTVSPTDMVSYTIQMAKNEIEACQFFLHSPTNRRITINLSDFTNDSGDTLTTELGVEFYVEEGWLPIKGYSSELVYPDAVVPYASYISVTSGGNYEEGPWVTIGPYTYNGTTKDTSQGFVIQAKTTKDSKPGLYRATLEIYDADSGECIKMADVYTYVYNVTLSDETALDTTFLVWDGIYSVQYVSNQQADALVALYNYMLDYRMTPGLSGWVISDLLCADGNYEWLYNPRVTTIRVHTQAQYEAWSQDPILAAKMFYYGQDEPGVARGMYRSITLEDGTTEMYWDPYGILTIIGIAEEAKMLQSWGWEDYKLLIPFERNPILSSLSAYPGITYGTTLNLTWAQVDAALDTDPNEERREAARALLNKYKDELIAAGDMISFMSEYVNMWVPCLFGYTPADLGEYYTGCWYLQTAIQDATYGELSERMQEFVDRGDERWTYVACNPTYTAPYQNLLLFCDGTSPETMMWTCFMEDITGFLYWHVSNYGVDEMANNTFTMRCPFPKEGAGDGLLFYPGSPYGQIDPIPSLRVIGLRDGIEDYELLTMLEKVKGEEYAKELASFVATSAISFTEDDQLLRDVRSYMLKILEEELNK